MAEELIGNLGYEAPQSPCSGASPYRKRKNSSNAFSLEIASYIWARFTLKISSPNLMKKKWKTL